MVHFFLSSELFHEHRKAAYEQALWLSTTEEHRCREGSDYFLALQDRLLFEGAYKAGMQAAQTSSS